LSHAKPYVAHDTVSDSGSDNAADVVGHDEISQNEDLAMDASGTMDEAIEAVCR